jgi:hypothetical protein
MAILRRSSRAHEASHGRAHRGRARGLLNTKAVRLAVLLAASVGGGSLLSPAACAQAPSEYEVKAVFLYNFAKFVEWPNDPSTNGREPIMVCIAGQDPFGRILDQTILDKTANGHPFIVKRFKKGEDAAGCQILFTSSSDQTYIRSLFAALKGSSVLTVGETEGFPQLGGIVNFTLKENKVRFEINVDAAERARLKISSKLLRVAKVVHDGQ